MSASVAILPMENHDTPPPPDHPDAWASGVRVETQTVQATHNAVKAEDLSIFIGARCLLANAELKIAEQPHAVQATTTSKVVQSGTCYGLVGVNGCGKSTLMRLIAQGDLPVPPTWDVFLVSQHLPVPVEHCPVEEVLAADSRRVQLLSEQASLEEQMAAMSHDSTQLFHEANARLLELQGEFSNWDGAEKNVTEILLALGFRRPGHVASHCSEPTIETPMNELSGGWRMKVQLAKGLWLQPKLLLLDEPTNHLGFQALQWLQEKLELYPHTTVVVSHDVSFLHDVCREIVWMKDLKLEALPRDMVSQEDLLRIQRKRSLNFHFTTPEGSDAENHGLSLHGVEFSHGGASSSRSHLQVKKEVRFSTNSRAVLLGKNGSGKSTFLDLCAGKLDPSRGSIDRTADLKIGHYSQLTDELDRNSTDTAASFLVRECRQELASHLGSTRETRLQSARTSRTEKTATQQKRLLEVARGVLSRFGFEGDVAITVPVDRLSGGQKALLKFAVLSLRPAHILLLDEPTNHLDAEACEALAQGLSEFNGGVVAVTHDELLIYRLIHCNWSTSELLVCRGGTVWRERNFGADCLNALKKEVHRAEETEVKSSKPPQQAPEHQSTNDATNPAVVTKGEVPPWLQRRSRTKEKKDQLKTVEVAVETKTVEDAVDRVESTIDMKTTLVTMQQPSGVADPRPCLPKSDLAEILTRKSNQLSRETSRSEGLHPAHIAVFESWEEAAESDAATDVPPDTEDGDVLETIAAAKLHKEYNGNASISLESVGCPQQASRPKFQEMISEPSELAMRDAGKKHGRHSRFRKDMVNLNKAVPKWLRKQENGEITPTEVLASIKTSCVAQQLRALHGKEFDEDQFVKDVLKHAAEKKTRVSGA